MADLNTKLARAVELCEETNDCVTSTFEKAYSFTTENISGYLGYFDLKDKSLLTVGSSGDQILNSYLAGASDITLIDINEYAKYFTYLKISSILCLNYKEFQSFFFLRDENRNNNKNMFSKEIFSKIKPILKELDYESYYFFNELFSKYESTTIRQNIIHDDEVRNKVLTGFNTYLQDETNYNNLKRKLHNISFKYINEDIHNTQLISKYDNIFLSNLCTYCNFNKLKSLIEKLSDSNLNENGKMLMAYLYDINFNDNDYEGNWSTIYKMPIVKKELKDYISEYHQIRDKNSFVLDKPEDKKDLVLIYKKKNNKANRENYNYKNWM